MPSMWPEERKVLGLAAAGHLGRFTTQGGNAPDWLEARMSVLSELGIDVSRSSCSIAESPLPGDTRRGGRSSCRRAHLGCAAVRGRQQTRCNPAWLAPTGRVSTAGRLQSNFNNLGTAENKPERRLSSLLHPCTLAILEINPLCFLAQNGSTDASGGEVAARTLERCCCPFRLASPAAAKPRFVAKRRSRDGRNTADLGDLSGS